MGHEEGWARAVTVCLVGCALGACNHASKPMAAGCCDRSDPARGDSVSNVRTDAEVASSLLAPAVPRFRREEGCARDFSPTGTASQDLAQLERLCGQGLAPILAEPATAVPSPAGVVDVPFTLASAACVRAGAITNVDGWSMTLLDARGASLAAASSTTSFGVVPVDGTVCVREPGAYRALLRLPSPAVEASTVTLQIWQASRD